MVKQRIAIFLPSLSGGGAERVMVTLANAFAARGYAVDLVLASVEGPYLKEVASSVRLIDLKSGRVLKALLPLARYLRQARPDAMLSAMRHANVVAICARMLARVSTRVVVSERSTISMECQQALRWNEKLNYILVPLLYPKADAICTVSRAASDDLVRFTKLPISHVTTIYNPFDLRSIERLAAEPLNHKWFRSSGTPVVLAAGRLTAQKDFSTLIRAFAKLRQTRAARLLILGEGELRSALEALVTECGLSSDDVQLPGFVDNPFPYLARCNLFVLSSRWEGLPGVLIQALACGAPVVSTNCPSGPDEILEQGRWGQLVPVGDADRLAWGMASVLDTPRSQLPDARQRAKDFEQSHAVDAYLKLLGF